MLPELITVKGVCIYKVVDCCCVQVREEVQLGPAELVFLLEDMWRKLDFSLAAAPAKKAPFLKVGKHTHTRVSSAFTLFWKSQAPPFL